MSYYDQAGFGQTGYSPATLPGARKRPALVTIAAFLLFACSACAFAGAAISFSLVNTVNTNLANEAAGPVGVDGGSGVMAGYGIVSVISAVPLLICGILILRGRQWMRVTTWVVVGLGALCLGPYGLASAVNAGASNVTLTNSSSDGAVIAATPHWYFGTTGALEILTSLMSIGVIVLIALPRSSAYFRVPTAFFMPGYAAYPGYPAGYPGYPTQPTAYPGYAVPPAGYPGSAVPPGYPGSVAPPAGYSGYPGYPTQPAYPAYPQAAAPWLAPATVPPANEPVPPSTYAVPLQADSLPADSLQADPLQAGPTLTDPAVGDTPPSADPWQPPPGV
jgi:hypothetical protein